MCTIFGETQMYELHFYGQWVTFSIKLPSKMTVDINNDTVKVFNINNVDIFDSTSIYSVEICLNRDLSFCRSFKLSAKI